MNYQTQTLVDVAYKALKKDITERVLIPGQKIILRELLERYGISETPIKQALNRLITEGLVENIPRKGVKVKNIRWEEIEELLDIRLMIETYYSKQIINNFYKNQNIKEKFLKNLIMHEQIIENATDVDDHFNNYYLDQEFHQLYLKCSENKKIMQVYNNLGTHIYANYIYGRQGKEETIEGFKEHRNIYNALVENDVDALNNCVVTHIANAKSKIISKIF